ncbi:MAG TPA: SynChlorMet cassette protein ScmC [Syntrophales bacterium]|nr:SynChlorMet cassette protein ScmC [Syntrophales bacterium]HOX93346.1 SynChlorMet cassette protein ScmC [Syntrophales bacterium]HPI56547.1 SynChlorMet cassette protein ScmC [Syntrophales bacterium]HPN25032.1 SynChlorMet cassette protein ScmC [Syntrophales bacterium]HQM29225.1 SynChlorMet cassette protein ScmC [Syntrophales bacterium]
MRYQLSLFDGKTWEIEACRDAGLEVMAWVEEFAAHLGLKTCSEKVGRCLRFGRIEKDSHSDGFPRFVPCPPGDIAAQGWRFSGVAGLVFFEHPEVRDLLCGIMSGNRSLVLRQFRHALLPVFDEVIKAGGLIVHGALLERRGSGVLLMGKSGAGKTTCCQRLPSNWRILGDDLALVVKDRNGHFLAHPLPTWSAVDSGRNKWPCRMNESVPLEALFVLKQSLIDSVGKLRGAEAAVAVKQASDEALMPLDIAHSRSGIPGRKELFQNAMDLSKAISTFQLRVSLTGRFWEKIEEVLGRIAEQCRGIESA